MNSQPPAAESTLIDTTLPEPCPPTERGSSAPEPSHLPPSPVPPHLRLLTAIFSIPLMAAATAFFGCISLICGLWDRSGRQQHFVARAWAATLLRLAFSPVRLLGTPRIDLPHPAVYASNHLSYMDTPVLFAKLPFQFRILAKKGLWKVPFVGWYLKRSGQVPIDSASPRSAIAGLLRGVSTLKSGRSLFVFPEGGRSPDGNLQTMASGGAFMAIRAGVPLVPIALIGTYEVLPMHVYALRPRPLKIVIGDPIPTVGLTTKDADALTARLFLAITNLYHQHSAPEPNSCTD
jgi:1-acyl-sn-glycerol-3-phosphate acyltransferase